MKVFSIILKSSLSLYYKYYISKNYTNYKKKNFDKFVIKLE
jgi:hypothetical protein